MNFVFIGQLMNFVAPAFRQTVCCHFSCRCAGMLRRVRGGTLDPAPRSATALATSPAFHCRWFPFRVIWTLNFPSQFGAAQKTKDSICLFGGVCVHIEGCTYLVYYDLVPSPWQHTASPFDFVVWKDRAQVQDNPACFDGWLVASWIFHGLLEHLPDSPDSQ